MFNILKAALEIAPKKDIRYYMNGVRVLREDKKLHIDATDGHVLFRATTECVDLVCMFDENTDHILSHESLTTVLKMYKKNQDVPLEVTDGVVKINGVVLTVVDGRFPHVERILNGKPTEGTKTGLTFEVLEKVAKAGKLVVSGHEKDSVGVMYCGDGISNIRYTVDSPDWHIEMQQAPARVKS